MNLDDYWQENKGFVAQVAAGLVVFLILLATLDGTVGAEVESTRSQLGREEQKLRQPAFSAVDRDAARADNEALRAAVARLAERAEFAPTEGFRTPGAPVTSEVYLAAVARARDELLPAAGRANVQLDVTLGLPQLSPTREDELERYLDGLDLVVRVLRIAIDEGVEEVRQVRIRLDARRGSRDGTGSIERTKVEFDVLGPNLAITRLLARTQLDFERPLVLEELELDAERTGDDGARGKLTFLVTRLGGELAGEVLGAQDEGGMP